MKPIHSAIMLKLVKLIAVITILFAHIEVKAQLSLQRSVIASAGANETGASELTATWTVGEAVIGKGSDGTILLTHGFQYPNEISLSIKHFEPNLDLTVYPNPTRGEVFIDVNASKAMTLRYSLYDLNGREIPLPDNTQQVEGHGQKRLDLTHLANATYLLVITGQSGQPLASIRIIKD